MTARSSLTAQIAEIDYELAQRRRVYARLDASDPRGRSERDLHMKLLGEVRQTLSAVEATGRQEKRATAEQEEAVTPFLRAAEVGVRVRHAIATHRRFETEPEEIEGSEVTLGVIAATRQLRWSDFAALLAAWGGA